MLRQCVDITEENIEDVFFMRKKQSKNTAQSIVVKTKSKETKSKIMSMKKNLKENEETKNVYVNDFLSCETMILFNYAKSLKNVGFRSVYAAGGKVFAKRSELSKPRVIRNEDDVNKLLLEATTHKTTRERCQDEAIDEEETYLSS